MVLLRDDNGYRSFALSLGAAYSTCEIICVFVCLLRRIHACARDIRRSVHNCGGALNFLFMT
jgi:hypothetical protein